MPDGVKLCAVARHDGAHLADWVAHHLHVGFDAVEVWVDGGDDPTRELLGRIAAAYPQVTARSAEELPAHEPYAELARRARGEGFTHVAFLGVDDYWTPRDLTSSIHDFLPEDPHVDVVSFQCAVDVPDAERAPFTHPLAAPVRLQLDGHLRSLVRLDDSVRRYGAHTARTAGGTTLLVRAPFAGGDRVPEDLLVRHWSELPEAFVLHAAHRSQPEYVASLARSDHGEYDVDRSGYVATEAPELVLDPPGPAVAAYDEARRAFLARVDVEELTAQAQELVHERATALVGRVAADAGLMAVLRTPLRGVRHPTLDEAYPGWDDRVVWAVDAVEERTDRTVVVGWAFSTPQPHPLELTLRNGDGREWVDLRVAATERPEVRAEWPEAPLACGFEVEVPEPLVGRVDELLLLVRVPGAPAYEATRLGVSTPSTRG